MIEQKLKLKFDKVAVALASCDGQKSKLHAVAGAERFWVAELRVRQLKIGSKSCFGKYIQIFQSFRTLFIILVVLTMTLI